MSAFGLKRGFIGLVLAVLLYSSGAPGVVLADAKNDGTPAEKPEKAKPGTIKVEAPAPLTERERLLLDRVEQLEKRMAELEAKGQPAAPSSSEAPASRPSGVMPETAPPGVGGTVSSGEVTSATPPAAVSAAPGTQERVSTKPAKAEPFAFADFTWLTGNARTKESPMDTKFFTPEIRADIDYVYDFAHPKDDTIGGSSEIFRSSEVQVTQLGVGGDFHYDNVRARLMTQFGLYSETTPRNDASPDRKSVV